MGFHVRKSIPLPGPFYYSVGHRKRRRRSAQSSGGLLWLVIIVAGVLYIAGGGAAIAATAITLVGFGIIVWAIRRHRRQQQYQQRPIAPPMQPAPSRYIPQSVRVAVAARDGGRCVRCGSMQELHYDHIVPFIKGGSNTVQNIQLLCGPCNRAKGGRW